MRIALGTDTGVGPHGCNKEEPWLLVENSLTHMQAIVAATGTAFECAHMDSESGTLEPGKLAVLLVVDGNPLDDVNVLEDKSKLLMIMQGVRAHKDLVTGG